MHVHTKKKANSGWSYIYVAWWNFWYGLKHGILGQIVTIAIFVLSTIELMGPMTHLIPDDIVGKGAWWHQLWLHDALAALLFLTALAMIWHHRKLHAAAERYQNLLYFVMVCAARIGDIESIYDSAQVSELLDGLIQTLDHRGKRRKKREKSLLNATILVNPGSQTEPFTIFAQDRHHVFLRDTQIPGRHSVAGQVVAYDEEIGGSASTIMYVPSTKYVHGVAIWSQDEPAEKKVFTETEVVPTTYKVVDPNTHMNALKCLLCIQIPLLKQLPGNGTRPYSVAVLSISGRKTDCLDQVCFTAAKLMAALLSEHL